ncbi:hypothetical protein GM418_10800 [Maribellus comscasis]|uniref:Uncharacterized protein n=1 Tax=Maribellus comscasis TaxID=2681766 RepID=A0A6I6JSR9_9BACT|nr:hypothetical protein [Maribellus comscasis]QGY44128.1 hypothetical protein GM418_10800 [Maribellus comscasis]
MAKFMTAEAENGEPLVINMDKIVYVVPKNQGNTMDIHFSKKALRIKWKLDIVRVLKENGYEMIDREV